MSVVPPVVTSPTGIIAEIKAFVEKAFGQVVAQAGNYVLIAHTDLTRLEAVGTTLAAAALGYLINRLKAIKL